MYTLVQNVGAGYAKILTEGGDKRGSHEDFVSEHYTLVEALEALADLEKENYPNDN